MCTYSRWENAALFCNTCKSDNVKNTYFVFPVSLHPKTLKTRCRFIHSFFLLHYDDVQYATVTSVPYVFFSTVCAHVKYALNTYLPLSRPQFCIALYDQQLLRNLPEILYTGRFTPVTKVTSEQLVANFCAIFHKGFFARAVDPIWYDILR